MCEWLLLIFIAANLVPPAKDLPEDGKYRLFHEEGIRTALSARVGDVLEIERVRFLIQTNKCENYVRMPSL